MGLEAGHKSQFTLSLLPPWKKDKLVNIIYCEVGRIESRVGTMTFHFVSTQCLGGRKCDMLLTLIKVFTLTMED